MERTKALAAEFGRRGGVGEKLQKLLEKRAEEKDSWVWTCHSLKNVEVLYLRTGFNCMLVKSGQTANPIIITIVDLVSYCSICACLCL